MSSPTVGRVGVPGALLVAMAASAVIATAATPPRRSTHPAFEERADRAADSSSGVVALRTPVSKEVLIRSGSFRMGSDPAEIQRALFLCQQEPWSDVCTPPDGPPTPTPRLAHAEDEQPPHDVYLSAYWIDRTEVTVARYRRCVRSGMCSEPGYGPGGARFDRPDLPVTMVRFDDAVRFCKWEGGRLPTEAEWERAARGMAGRRYPWGWVYNPFLSNHGRLAHDPHDDADGFLELAPAGSFPEGRTPDGIHDLAGNVAEWVADFYAPYPEADAENPKGPGVGEHRVVRGGSYISARSFVRGSARSAARPSSRSSDRGFRCARSASMR